MNSSIDNYSFESSESKLAAKQFFTKVYAFMFGALIVSGLIAYQYGNEAFIMKYFINNTPTGASLSPLFYVVIFSPLGVAFIMQRYLERLSFAALFGLFMLYSVLIGFSLSTIFITYTDTSIFAIFGISAATFGVMAIMGYVTSADLTKFGSILMMAFWGIMIASLINFFLESEGFQYLISIIGVLVFTGLTAYHMQQLKQLAHNSTIDEEHKNKLALIGGFTLYILFVNLFVSLLRLFGSRD
jgi:FtsH-binding integral membrane protein